MNLPSTAFTAESTHVRFKLAGNAEKKDFFFYVLRELDPDFPIGRGWAQTCPSCVGHVWRRPRLTQQELKTLGSQVNGMPTSLLNGHLKVKLKDWRTGNKCTAVDVAKYIDRSLNGD